jgi:hypothetical protein
MDSPDKSEAGVNNLVAHLKRLTIESLASQHRGTLTHTDGVGYWAEARILGGVCPVGQAGTDSGLDMDVLGNRIKDVRGRLDYPTFEKWITRKEEMYRRLAEVREV